MNGLRSCLITCVAVLSVAGCLRNDTSCAEDTDCFGAQVCQAGACVMFVTVDAGPLDVGGDATSTPDAADAADAADTADAADVADAPDAGPPADAWVVLARTTISYPVRSVLRANGDLTVAYDSGDSSLFEFVTRRGDGTLVTPKSADPGTEILSDWRLIGGDVLRIVYADFDGDLMVMTHAAQNDAWSSRELIPRVAPRLLFYTTALQYFGGRLAGAFVDLRNTPSGQSGEGAVWFDENLAEGGLLELQELAFDEAIPEALTVPLPDGAALALWHSDRETVRFARVSASGAFSPAELDRGSGGVTYEHGRFLRAALASNGGVWVAYAFGSNSGHDVRVVVIKPDGTFYFPYDDLDLGEFGDLQDLDLVVRGDEAHLVIQRSSLESSDSSLVWASYDGTRWIEDVLDSTTPGSRFVRAYGVADGAHVVYTGYSDVAPVGSELRYQWVDL